MTETESTAPPTPTVIRDGRTARAMLGRDAVALALPSVVDRQILMSAHLHASGYRGEGVPAAPADGHDLVAIHVAALALSLRGGTSWQAPTLRSYGRDPIAYGEAALTSIVDSGIEPDARAVIALAGQVWDWVWDTYIADAEAVARAGFRPPTPSTSAETR